MAATIDVYKSWLAISEPQRPLNYYQLLKLSQFEDDVSKIRNSYRDLNAHVRKYAAGEYQKQSQDLLNELAKAMLCLTDAVRKGEYDASLGRKTAPEGRRRTMEEILISQQVIDAPKLEKARSFAAAVGMEVRDALVQQKLISSDAVMQAYAETVGLPFIDLSDITPDPALCAKFPQSLARRNSCLPIMEADGQLLVATPNILPPDVEEELRLRFGMTVRGVLCTPAEINKAIETLYRAAAPEPGAAPGGSASGGSSNRTLSVAERAEQKKNARSYAILGLSFTFILLMFYFSFMRSPPTSTTTAAPISFIVGAIVAGGVYYYATKR